MKRIQPLDTDPLASVAVGVPIPKQRHNHHHHHQQQQQLQHPAVPPVPSAVVPKSRLKRLFERQLPSLHRVSSSERLAPGDHSQTRAVDPSSLCLTKMVHSFLEGDTNGGSEEGSRPHLAANSSASSGCGRSRCNCFSSNCCSSEEGSPEDEFFDLPTAKNPNLPPPIDTSLVIKNLLLRTSPLEKSLLTDVSTVLEKPKTKLSSSSLSAGSGIGNSSNNTFCSKTHRLAALVEALISLGHDASICRSSWDAAPSLPAGEHEYADVLFPNGDRLILDLDFRSEFQVARPTKEYRSVLSVLPTVLVAAPERLKQVVGLAAGAARKSLGKKGLHVAPWRTEQYMQAKWLSPDHKRVSASAAIAAASAAATFSAAPVVADVGCWGNFGGVATASVVHRSRTSRVAPGIAGCEPARGVNARSRPAQPPPPLAAARRSVGWVVTGPGFVE